VDGAEWVELIIGDEDRANLVGLRVLGPALFSRKLELVAVLFFGPRLSQYYGQARQPDPLAGRRHYWTIGM
jgi:hypothetical protein